MRPGQTIPCALLIAAILSACSTPSLPQELLPTLAPTETARPPAPTHSPAPPLPTDTIAPTMLPTEVQPENTSGKRQWAQSATSNIQDSQPELAVGAPDSTVCASRQHAWTDPDPRLTSGELSLELSYRTPVIPSLVQVYQSGSPGGIIRVELLDSSSGLGSLVYEETPAPSSPCLQTLSIPIVENQAIDTVIITLAHSESPTYIDAVELVGLVPGWEDHPILWQIPVLSGNLLGRPSLPGSIAASRQGDLYLANGRHGLYRFDASGAELKRYSVPTEANLSDIVPAPGERLLVTDTAYRWWILLNAAGIQDVVGGEDFSEGNPLAAAFGPTWDAIYLLDQGEVSSRIRVYDVMTAELLRDLPLPSGTYRSLVVDVDGLIYTLDVTQGLIQILDPGDGAILDSYGYLELPGTIPIDLALDDKGNIYVLMQENRDDSTVYIYDKKGSLSDRVGQLVYNAEERQPGFFYQPASITVAPDGKRLYILEPGLITAYDLEG